MNESPRRVDDKRIQTYHAIALMLVNLADNVDRIVVESDDDKG